MGHTPDHLPAPPASFNLLDGTNGFSTQGLDIANYLGFSRDGAGDMNGDGIDDLIFSAPGASPNGIGSAGSSYVIFGKPDGHTAIFDLLTLDGNNGFRLDGAEQQAEAGRSSKAGDVNGDGLADIIVGAPGAPGTGIAGQGYVIFGSNQGFPATQSLGALDGSNGFSINSSDADILGTAVSDAGDINGDGFSDFIIADPGYPSTRYIVFGTGQGTSPNLDLTLLDGNNGFQVTSDGAFYSGGTGMGDFNGDGFDDMVFAGNPVIVMFGANGGFPPNLDIATLDGSNSFQITTTATISGGGFAIGAGDFNGDGIADLMTGDAAAQSADGSLTGRIYVVFGSDQGLPASLDVTALNGSNGFRLDGAADEIIGHAGSGAGDVNSDGFDEIIFRGTTNDEFVHVVYGNNEAYPAVVNATTLYGAQGFRIESLDAWDDGFWLTVSDAGDVTGDGFDDFLAASIYVGATDVFYAGKVHTIFGNDFTASVTHAGTAGADTLTGTAGGDVMVGGVGDDSLRGNGGADVLKGGSGQDVLAISDAGFRRLDGGGGMDTLKVAGFNLDLSAVPDMRVSDIETIDLTDGGPNQIILEFRDMRNLSDTSNTITIIGDSGDKVIIDLTGTGLQPVDQGNGFIAYTAQAVNNGPTLLVQDSLDLSAILF